MEYIPIIGVSRDSHYRLQVLANTPSCRILRAQDLSSSAQTLVIEIPDYTKLQPNWQIPLHYRPHLVGAMVANRLGFAKDSGVLGPNVKDLRPKPKPKFRVVDPRTGEKHTYCKVEHAHRIVEILSDHIRDELARAYPNAAVPFCPPHIPVVEVFE
jgi:hypothetical protein